MVIVDQTGWYSNPGMSPPLPGLYTENPPPTRNGSLMELLGLITPEYWRMVAAHEAGHAVVAEAAGRTVLNIEFRPFHRSVPATCWQVGNWAGRWQDALAICAAGERAAARWLRQAGLYTRQRAWVMEVCGADDRVDAENLTFNNGRRVRISYGRPGTADVDWATVCRWADACLADQWSAVMAVARELVRHGGLDGHDVRHIIRNRPC